MLTLRKKLKVIHIHVGVWDVHEYNVMLEMVKETRTSTKRQMFPSCYCSHTDKCLSFVLSLFLISAKLNKNK